jgi:hypothetical protein
MPIRFQCACGRSLRATQEQIGRKVRCPVCDAVRTVPGTKPSQDEEILQVLPAEPPAEDLPVPAVKLPDKPVLVDDAKRAAKPRLAPAAPFYPPSPAEVPANFIMVSAGYRWRVVLVLVSLLLFAALYVALVIGAGFLVYWSVVYRSTKTPAAPSPSR